MWPPRVERITEALVGASAVRIFLTILVSDSWDP